MAVGNLRGGQGSGLWRLAPPRRAKASGSASHDFLKDAAEIVAGAEAKLFRDFLNGERGAAQKDFGAVCPGKFDIIIYGKLCLFLEFAGEVVFRVAHQGGQILRLYLFFQISLNIVAALLDVGAESGIGAAFVDSPDEIVVHDQPQGRQFTQALSGFDGLDIAVAQGVGFLGGQSALHGGAADDGGEDRQGGLGLAQGVPALQGHSVAHHNASGECLLIVDIPVANHLQQSLLRHPYGVPVGAGIIRLKP